MCNGTAFRRILVVEDELPIGEICHRTLTHAGFAVDVAVNGEMAQRMLAAAGYDLCLIDIRLPVKNGKQLFQSILSDHPMMASRVIFTSGDTLDSYTARFLELVNRPFLAKPFTPEELLRIVTETLRQIDE